MLILYEDMSVRKRIREDIKAYTVGYFVIVVDVMYIFSIMFAIFGGMGSAMVFKSYWFVFAFVAIIKMIKDDKMFSIELREWEGRKALMNQTGIFKKWEKKWKAILILYFSLGCLSMATSIFAAVVMKR
jgi:hypothetical protein